MKAYRIWNAVLFAAALIVCAALSAVALPLVSETGGLSPVCIPLTLLYAFGAWLLLSGSRRRDEAPLEPLWLAAILAAVALTLFTRLSLFPHESDDFLEYLSVWLGEIRALPGFSALQADIGNYNMPYFYLLFAFGKLLPQSADLYAIKLVSVLFDYVLAWFVMKLVMLRTERRAVAIAAFLAALLVPSIIVNGAMWGQCDSIFTAFALGGLYYGLRRRSRLCWAFFAIALSVKLQSVFLLPMLLALLFAGRIRLRDLWVFPAVFVLMLVPAMLAGRGFIDCVTIYWRQANSYSELSMLAPTVYAWFPAGTRSNIPVTAAGVFAAGTIVFLFILYLFRRRERLDDGAMIEAAFLFAMIIPFFLPLMHERYFYAADAMAAVYLFWRPRRWYVCALVCAASFLCHIAYLFDAATVPLWLLSFFMLGAICLTLRDFLRRVETRPDGLSL
ncbi:MAG: glycosyltransferase 87 family protein [Clostridia bacterium]|nr:glycosyltransferase 87 family protein [Clostridia bacterium]